MTTDARAQALGDLRVVDCSRLIARGVLATTLADLGADVIKVENPRGGDPIRTWSKSLGELWWKVYGRGKRSITLNLTRPEGQALLRRLVRTTDVLIENYLPGTFEKWGLGWDALSAENPRLVMVRVSGWGQDGPYRDRPGTMVEAGTVTMSAPTPRLTATPGSIRWPGPPLGAHNQEIYTNELGLSEADLTHLRTTGII